MSVTFVIAVTVDPIEGADIVTYTRAENAVYAAMEDAAHELRSWMVEDAISEAEGREALTFKVETSV